MQLDNGIQFEGVTENRMKKVYLLSVCFLRERDSVRGGDGESDEEG